MKANAPKKIYLTEDNPSKEWYRTKQVGFDSIEYTRTDAFIEKACTFLETYPHMFFGVLRSDMIEDFKKYMEE